MAAQRTAVVFGGTGFVGRHLVQRWLDDGVRVVVPSRSERSLEDLQRRCGGNPAPLVPLVLDISNPDGMEAVRTALGEAGGVDYAVASMAGWWEGDRLVDLAPTVWQDILQSHLTAHFLAAKAAVGNLRDDTPHGPAFVTLNGIAALQPEARSGPVSITGTAQAMLLDVLRAENDRPHVRFHEVCVVNPIVVDGEAENAGEAVVEITDVVDELVATATRGDGHTARVTLGHLAHERCLPR